MSPEGRGRLVLVATPIGNLGDLSPRAREVLATADLICCEDTRRTRALLSAIGVAAGGPGGDRLLSLHGHNEPARLDRVAAAVAGGATVAVVSDAGTPGISDPGAWLAAQLAASGETVSTVPGPSSVVGALVVSGLPADRFCVEGFLPRKGSERRRRMAALMADERTSVVLEAPGRVAATLGELCAADPDRPVAVVRELTKLHEEVWRGTLVEAADAFAARQLRGKLDLDQSLDETSRVLAEKDRSGRRQPLHAGGEVHRVAEDRETGRAARLQMAEHSRPRVDPDPHVAAKTEFLLDLGPFALEVLEDGESRPARPERRVLLRDRHAEHHHHPIAGDVLDPGALGLNHRFDDARQSLDQAERSLFAEALRKRCEADHVREENDNLTALCFQGPALRR